MKNLILFIFLSITLGASGQAWLQLLPTNKKASELSLYDYKKAFDTYWEPFQVDNRGYYQQNGVKTKAAGWKQFQRWYYNMESQVEPATGAFPKKSAQEVYDEFYKNHPKNNSKAANWSNMGPNSSNGGYAGVGRVNCVAFHPTDNNTYWVGAPTGGLWKTTDDGSSWTCLTDNNNVLGVSDIIIPPDYAASNTIYIATGDRDSWDNNSIGVLKSTDGGQTWNTTGLSFQLSAWQKTNRLLLDPNNNQVLIAATNGGVYKTTDGGTTWNNQLTNRSFIDMEYKPDNFNVLYGCNTEGIVSVSSDGGSTWADVTLSTAGKRVELAVSPANYNYVYALVAASNDGLEGVYRSSNQGTDFTQLLSGSTSNLLGWENGNDAGGQGFYDLSLAVSPTDANTIWVGGVNTWKSTDGGSNWSLSNHWYGNYEVQAVHADKHNLKYRSNGDLFECNDGGIYLLQNGSSTWHDKTNGMIISQMYKLGVSATVANEVITGLQDNGTKLHSSNSWSDVKGGDGMECLIDYTDVNIQYGSYVNGQISRTSNHWSSSTDIKPSASGDGAWVTPYIIDPTNSATLYAGYADVWKTTDRGANWTKISSMNTSDKLRSMAIAPSDNNYICVADQNTIWRTANGGSTWNNITGGIPVSSSTNYLNGTYITSIAIKADDPNTIWLTLSNYNQNAVYESTNGGTSWTNISAGLPHIPAYSVVQNVYSTNETHLYVGTELGVYFKKGTDDWIQYNTNLPKVKCGELEIYYNPTDASQCKLYAATYGRGLWQSPLEDFDINQLIISEVAAPGDNYRGRFVEIYNAGTQNVAFNNIYLQRQKVENGISTFYGAVLNNTYTLAAQAKYVCTSYSGANTIYGSDIDGQMYGLWTNKEGQDTYILRQGGEHGLILDIYGAFDTNGNNMPWDCKDAQAVRKNTVNQGSATWSADEWVITQNATTNIMTPGEHAENKIWTGDTDTDWSTKTNWTSINGRQFLPDPASKVSIASSSNQPNIATDICVHDLTTSDATAQLTIAAGNSLKVLNTLSTTNNNSLVLESNASSNATLLHNTDGVAATVKIWHPNLLHIYYTGSPMTNTTANVFFGQYLYKWDEPSSAWVNIVEPTTALDPTRGYAVEKKNNTQAEYAGILNNGNINSVSITQQGSNADGKGWNLIANPYPSVIDMNEMNFDNANTGIEASVKVMKHLATGTTAVGSDYLTWSQGAGSPSGDNQARYIQPGQAFWVKATQTTAQTLIFTNAMRTKANIGVFDKGNDSPVDELRISLLRHDTLVDRTYISFRKGATPGYDLNYDASIMNESLAPLYTLIGEKRMAINAIDNPLEVERIKTGVNVEAGSYTLYAEQMDSFDDEQDFYLFDRKTQKYINLRQQYVYAFDMAADDEPYRFDICFATNEGVEDNLATTNNYYTYSQNNMLFIKAQNVTTETVAVSIYNTLGQLVYQNPHHKLSQAITLASQQAYILSISDKTSASTHKVVIK